jgi:hypothetical protein
MDKVLLWNDAVAYFGDELDQYKARLQRATQATQGLLACRSVRGGDTMLASRDGDHSEVRLIDTDIWKQQLPAALDAWTPGDDPMIVLLAINRSPCGNCAAVLANALHALNDRFPMRCEQQHFVLASLGYYQGAGFMKGGTWDRGTVTTHKGLQAAHDAGWRQCVLDFGLGVTRRGGELLEYLRANC